MSAHVNCAVGKVNIKKSQVPQQLTLEALFWTLVN